MAIASLQRLASQISRNPSLSISSRAIIFCSSTSISSSSAKVADRVVKLFVIDPDGQKQGVIGLSSQTLLKAFANCGLIDLASHRLEDIDACSAECEVHVAQEWLEKLPPAIYDKQYVLKRNSRSRLLNKHSRLGCQVILTRSSRGWLLLCLSPSHGTFHKCVAVHFQLGHCFVRFIHAMEI